MIAHAVTRACVLAALIAMPLAHAAPDGAVKKQKTPAAKGGSSAPAMTFGWPFTDPEKMKVRGGITTGTKITLDPEPSEAWKRLHQTGEKLSDYERDRRAILAMAGTYRVSFQFVETMGFTPGYTPPRPYFSWGTEEVRVLHDSKNLISLQHTLVMYFKDKDGNESEPMVMKHWRQDWKYQDNDLHTYRGNNRWRRVVLPRKNVAKRWSQTVYQVDDSPRYEATGAWRHARGMSTWNSVLSWRPLPRREFSVRDDYNVLECAHIITITPNGWVHTQNNRKIDVHPGEPHKYLARELGINRYERITAPDLVTPADDYYAKTGRYWNEVRTKWAEVFKKYEQFELKASYEDMKLYQHHFGYAAKLMEEEEGPYKHRPARTHARTTIENFLKVSAKALVAPPPEPVPKN